MVATSYSDSEGSFSFSDLPSNYYHVIVNNPGYEPVQITVALGPLATQTAMVQFNLIPKGSPTLEPSARPGSNPYTVELEEYTKTYPKPAIKAFKSGLKARDQGRNEDALKNFRKAVDLSPDFYPARNNLGSEYLGKGDFLEAAEQFQKVIKLRPNDATAYFNLGNVFLLTKRFPEAQATLKEGLKKQPNAALGEFLMGTVYEHLGKPQEAERMLNDALAADPTMSKVHLELVNLYLQQKMKPQAIAELKSFLVQFPQDPLAGNARAVLARLQSGAR